MKNSESFFFFVVSTKQTNKQTTKQPNNQTTKQTNKQTTKQPNNQTTKQPNNQTTKQPNNQTTKQPTQTISNPTKMSQQPAQPAQPAQQPDERGNAVAGYRKKFLEHKELETKLKKSESVFTVLID